MSYNFYLEEALESDFCVILQHFNRIFEIEGYLQTFKTNQRQKYLTVQTDLDKFLQVFVSKKKLVETKREELKRFKAVWTLDQISQEIQWLQLSLYGDYNYSGDFRSVGLLNFLAGAQQESLPLLRKIAIWSKHLIVGQELKY